MAYYQQSNTTYGGTSGGTGSAPQNLQFYPSSYGSGTVSGHTTPFQAQGYGQQSGYGYSGGVAGGGPSGGSSAGGAGGGGSSSNSGGGGGYTAPAGGSAYGSYGISGSMGTQGGLRTGWLAGLSPEGYEGEPPLLEELGVNFGHIKTKVSRA